MTHRVDAADGRDIMARWCALAEQRLGYLSELFESGRWRRYYTERAFLENIREAKTAVEVWRGLAARKVAPDHAAADASQPDSFVESPSFDVSIAIEATDVSADDAPSAPASDAPVSEPAMDEVAPTMGAQAFDEQVLDDQVFDDQVLDEHVLDEQLLDSEALDEALDEPSPEIASHAALNFDTIEQRYPSLRNAL